VCGDSYVVATQDSKTTVAVADGLGHGPEAAEASVAFCAFVEERREQSPHDLMAEVRPRLAGTRGAAAAVLRFDEDGGTLEFAGVGNIEVHAHSDVAIHPVSTPGIVGQHVRKIIPFRYDLSSAALFAVFSDGISSRFDIASYRGLEPQAIADAILQDHGKDYDDATCVVIRYS
jgi:negative regulator of sigma-B (phosphoserine phosphatase)